MAANPGSPVGLAPESSAVRSPSLGAAAAAATVANVDLVDLRVRNYRTIRQEQVLPLDGGATLVGPNNAGKTNLLRATELLFTGYGNSLGYSRERDFPSGVKEALQTSLVATFRASPASDQDREILSLLDELHSLVSTTRESESFSVNLYFTNTATPVYRVFPNAKIPSENRPGFSRKQKQLVETLLGRFRPHYVPSAKSTADLFTDLLQPLLIDVAVQAVEAELAEITRALAAVGESLTEELGIAGLRELRAGFSFPDGEPRKLLRGFDLLLDDPLPTPLFHKGQGIQSAALFAAFIWVSRRERRMGFEPLWLIEEPESYLHPELASACYRLLERLSEGALVVVTTHGLAFVPQDVRRITGVTIVDDHTEIESFQTHREATQRIRASLGVRFSDFYNLGDRNVFVEGSSDRSLLEWILERIPETEHPWPHLRRAFVEQFGGVKQLEGFLRGAYALIRRERPAVSLLDGDPAGARSRQDLQRFFGGMGVPFEPNLDFVSVRSGFAIEGLFPDEWIIQSHDSHPEWFEVFSVDAGGDLEPFRIRDQSKAVMLRELRALAEAAEGMEWAGRWIQVCDALDQALGKSAARLDAPET